MTRNLLVLVVLPAVVVFLGFALWGRADFESSLISTQSYFGWDFRPPAYGSRRFIIGVALVLLGAVLLLRRRRPSDGAATEHHRRSFVGRDLIAITFILFGEAVVFRSLPLVVFAIGYPVVCVLFEWFLRSTADHLDEETRRRLAVPRFVAVFLIPALGSSILYAVLDQTLPSPEPVAAKSPDDIRIHFLKVASGHCSIIECPGTDASPIIYDCGSFSSKMWGREMIGIQAMDYLHDIVRRAQGAVLSDLQIRDYVWRILDRYTSDPIVVISHPHNDHYNLIPTITKGRSTKAVYYGGDLSSFNDTNRRWIDQRDGTGFGGQSGFHNLGAPHDALQCGKAQSHILTVNVDNPATPDDLANANSLILSITYEDFRMLFTGDAEGVTEASVLQNFPSSGSGFWNIGTTVMQVAHHGGSSKGSSSAAWIDRVRPKAVIYSGNGSSSSPACLTVDKYRHSGFLSAAKRHPIQCGNEGGGRDAPRRAKTRLGTGRILDPYERDDHRDLRGQRPQGRGLP